MSMADPERVDVEATPLLQGKEQRPTYSGDAGKSAVSGSDADGHAFPPHSPDGHYPFLDITRICCVWLVAVDHGNATFGAYNSLFGQEWVLQFLYLVCGVCYGMSRRSLLNYEFRLAQYVVIGIMLNWCAWVVAGLDWQHNFFGMVFHFWFVVGLMLYAAILAPLKPYLQRARDLSLQADNNPEAVGTEAPEESEQDHRDALLRGLLLIGGGLLGIMLVFTVVMAPVIESAAPITLRFFSAIGANARDGAFWGLPSNIDESQEFLQHMSTYIMLTVSNMYLLIVCPVAFKRSTWTPWCLLAYTYSHRMLFYRSSDERPFHGLDLMTIAMAVYYLGLQNRRKIGEYLIRYWFVLLFVCALLWEPGTHQRFDEVPPTTISTRVRVNLLEAIFVIAWFLAGDRMVQKEIFSEDRLDFLNLWALIVFLVHKAVHIVFPQPINWLILLGLAPICYYASRKEPDS
mmetsp:Transcript_63436/g.163237  ORF Transcript_63436/g.163237 Transcript_63436/m.163237 type:complete len:459 (+) Transcript_63436:69-1445(+)